jgi:hypothetical protein
MSANLFVLLLFGTLFSLILPVLVTKYDTILLLLCGGDNLSVMQVAASSLLISPGEHIYHCPRYLCTFNYRRTGAFVIQTLITRDYPYRWDNSNEPCPYPLFFKERDRRSTLPLQLQSSKWKVAMRPSENRVAPCTTPTSKAKLNRAEDAPHICRKPL